MLSLNSILLLRPRRKSLISQQTFISLNYSKSFYHPYPLIIVHGYLNTEIKVAMPVFLFSQTRRSEGKGCGRVSPLKVKGKAINIQYKMIKNKREGWHI